MVLLASSFDQSKFLRAVDLAQAIKLRIKSVTEELLGQGANQEKKPVVWFANHKKGLPLNKTNLRTLWGAFGDDMSGWAGKVIEVFPTQTDYAGRQVGALRVRIPSPKTPKGQLDKFAPAAKPAPATKQEPEPDEDLEIDLDDEISF
jgi:hypothetical protein